LALEVRIASLALAIVCSEFVFWRVIISQTPVNGRKIV
jgi:hypothetical protein